MRALGLGILDQVAHHQRHHAEVGAGDERVAVRFVTVGAGAEPTRLSCSFLYLCSGYYRYDHGYQPDFPGRDDFAGVEAPALRFLLEASERCAPRPTTPAPTSSCWT